MKPAKNTNLKFIIPVKNFVDRALAEGQVWINSSAYYQSDLLLRILLDVALKKSSVGDICSSNDKYPSPDTVMAMLAKSHCHKSREDIEKLIAELFQNQVKNHLMFKSKKIPKVMLAIDLHDEEYYGKHLYDGDMRLTMFSSR